MRLPCRAVLAVVLGVIAGHGILRADDYEVGGPLEGLKLSSSAKARVDKVSYPGSVEAWTGRRGFFDQQSLLRNWIAADMPTATLAAAAEDYAGAKVVRCGVGGPVFRLDLGELDVGLYAGRVIGTVEKARLRPFREPIYVTMKINDGLDGQSQCHRMRIGYSEEFRSVVEIYFHAVARRRFQAELWVDRGSTVDLLVHNITLDDVLAGTTRRAIKKRMTLLTPGEVTLMRSTFPEEQKKKRKALTPYTPAERLARDEAIWKWQPPANAQGTIFDKAYTPKNASPGTADRTAAEIRDQYGQWTAVEEWGGLNVRGSGPPRRPKCPVGLIENKKLGLQYTMDDYLARRPLPDPYPYKDDGAGLYFPDAKDPDAGRFLTPLGDVFGHRLRTSGWIFQSRGDAWLQSGDRDVARDLAVALIAYAYHFPTYDAENALTTVMHGRSPWQRIAGPRWLAGSWLNAPECYDKLFDYIHGNEELARSVRRFVPWVKSSEDLVRLLDVYLVQITAKHILRRHYGLDNAPAQIAEIAAILGDPSVTDPWMEWLFAKTSVYGVGTGGILDMMILGNGREGAGYIGSTFYSQEEGARTIGIELQRYLAADGNPKYGRLDAAMYPKPLAHCYWALGILVAGIDFARIGDVAGPDKPPGNTMRKEFESACRYGWKWSSDPRFAWVLKNVLGRKDESDTEWSAVEQAAGKLKRAPWLDNRSRALENWFGVLESGHEHDDYRFHRAVYVRTGVGHGHEHGDTLDLQACAHGLPMTVDVGLRGGYAKPNCRMSRIHNVVEVDGFQGGNCPYGLCSYSWISALSDTPGTRYLEARALPPIHATLYRRQVAMVDVDEGRGSEPLSVEQQKPGAALKPGVTTASSYIFDVFRVSGGKLHTYGFHGPVSDDVQWNVAKTQPVADTTVKELVAAAGGANAEALARGEKIKINTVDDTRDDADYLAVFNRSGGAKLAGRCPEQFQATWRYTRDGKDGSEQQMLGPNYDERSPRKFTRLTVFDAAAMRALKADLVTTPKSSAHFTLTHVMLQNRASGNSLDSAFTALIEPYAGESRIDSARAIPVRDNDADARRAVAVEVKLRGGRTDVCFADGHPEKTRTLGELRLAGEFACYSTDAHGLRLATLTGGTLLESPRLKLKLTRRERTGKVVKVDYRAKTFWIDAVWPAASGGKLFEIGTAQHTTSYTSQSVACEPPGSRIVVTRGADVYRSPLVAVRPEERLLKGALRPPPGVVVQDMVASNDTLTKFWRVSLVDDGFRAAEGTVGEADFAPSGTLRIWEYGAGDSVRQSTSASVRRVDENVFEVIADVDAAVSWQGGKVESSTDRKTWTPATVALMPGWSEVKLNVEETRGVPVFLRMGAL